MSVGEKIKRIRNFRGLTQKELGNLIGFNDSTADVRIAQYESGTRTPKTDILSKIAEVLDVNMNSLREPCSYSEKDVMLMLFELEEHYMTIIWEMPEIYKNISSNHAIQISSPKLEKYITKWKHMRDMLSCGKISRSEYLEWKLKWSADKEEYNMNSDDYFSKQKLREMYARELQVSTGLRATLENIIPANRKIIIDITTSGENPNRSQIQKISMIDTDGNLLYDNIYSAQEIAKINEILLSAETIIGYDLGKVIAFLRAAYCVWRSDYEFISLKNNYRDIDLSVRTELDFKSFTSYFGYDDNTDDTVDRCRAMLYCYNKMLEDGYDLDIE